MKVIAVLNAGDWKENSDLFWKNIFYPAQPTHFYILATGQPLWRPKRGEIAVAIFPCEGERIEFHGARICTNASKLLTANDIIPLWIGGNTACVAAVRIPQKMNAGLAQAIARVVPAYESWIQQWLAILTAQWQYRLCTNEWPHNPVVFTPWGEKNESWVKQFLQVHLGLSPILSKMQPSPTGPSP